MSKQAPVIEATAGPKGSVIVTLAGIPVSISPQVAAMLARDLLQAAKEAQALSGEPLPPVGAVMNGFSPVVRPSRLAHSSLAPNGENATVLLMQFGAAVISFDVPPLLEIARQIVAASSRPNRGKGATN